MIRFCIFSLLCLLKLNAIGIPQDLQSARSISITEKNDGFGSQLQRRMSAIAFAIVHNKEYVHRPFTSLQHNYDKNPTFHKEMEEFANIGLEFPLIEHCDDPNLYLREDYRYYTDLDIDGYYNSHVLSLLRRNYYSTPKPEITYFEEDRIDVAVHIRRGDVRDTGPMGRWVCDEHYLKAMDKIRKKYHKVKFHIYSEGNIDQFTKFQSHDVEFHLNEEIRSTFHGLVSADILILSKGGFSYSAGLLSEGTVYYTKHWNPKLAHWIQNDDVPHPVRIRPPRPRKKRPKPKIRPRPYPRVKPRR